MYEHYLQFPGSSCLFCENDHNPRKRYIFKSSLWWISPRSGGAVMDKDIVDIAVDIAVGVDTSIDIPSPPNFKFDGGTTGLVLEFQPSAWAKKTE